MIALYLLGAVLILLVTAALLAPLFVDREPDLDLDELPPEERREAALEALREVEFEHDTGKLADGEYERLRALFGRTALEAEEEAGTRSAAASGPERTEPRSAEGRFCTECGGEVPAGARYCPDCGRPVGGGDAR